ncbi:hypothetical protein FJ938_14505 [Mesorhizobium sp. B2-4-14]|uniref:hypothetical protein n=1 Tax=Mesorhizobium sp. B2-4-14 TaxID=2589935 RepID=UPI00112BC4D5|nr:hypothetical protein [Mesorhizobium sp. B2-4-14]TPL05822.1 hypothetical protein FJ938_14505 [Mesorhizobium sp. B2-4-14]
MAKLDGWMVAPESLTPEESAAVGYNLDLLLKRILNPRRRPIEETLSQIASDPGKFQHLHRAMNIGTGQDIPAAPERAYFAYQYAALEPRLWRHPVNGLLYSATQVAIHEVLRRHGHSNEETITERFIEALLSILAYKVAPAMRQSKLAFPEGCHLRLNMASMQGHRDYLGSDLAIVTGAIVHGVPRLRVVLMQAKKERRRGSSDISRTNFKQLDELLATGMGYYLFYPHYSGTGFLPLVRSAESIFAQSRHSDRSVKTCHYEGEVGLDIALFVSVAMSSATTG